MENEKVQVEMNNNFNGHIASLDGLRALAVMSVMAIHSGLPGFQTRGGGR
jgi:peptidoglycan/LPS O-acetylase OafA/YrhL